MEIIAMFDKPKPPSMRSIAREYAVDEKGIWGWDKNYPTFIVG
jgi:hypothetical protein